MTEKQLKQHYHDRMRLVAKIVANKGWSYNERPRLERLIGLWLHYDDKYEVECVLRGEGTEATVKGLSEGSCKPICKPSEHKMVVISHKVHLSEGLELDYRIKRGYIIDWRDEKEQCSICGYTRIKRIPL